MFPALAGRFFATVPPGKPNIAFYLALISSLGFSGGSVIKKPPYQCRRHGFDLWVRKIPWRRKWQPTPVFLPEKFHEQRILESCSPWGHKRVRQHSVTKTMTTRTNLFFGSVWIHVPFYSDELTIGFPSCEDYMFLVLEN